MPLLKITIPGLSAIACAVVLLWTCLLGERVLMHRADEQRAAVIRSMARLHRSAAPTERPPSVEIRRSQRPLNS